MRLVGAEKPDNWVFTNPNAILVLTDPTPSRLIINASDAGPGDLPDIRTGMEAARILYTIDCAAATRLGSTISLDPEISVFGSGDPNHELEIPVNVSDAASFLCPEPGGLAVLAVAAALQLRRGRRPT